MLLFLRSLVSSYTSSSIRDSRPCSRFHILGKFILVSSLRNLHCLLVDQCIQRFLDQKPAPACSSTQILLHDFSDIHGVGIVNTFLCFGFQQVRV
ncbi:hypothetical protein OWV82_007014 [Melia azedarach]|uniref:Uncharacterized protein n=1 Tax=Melia azedarach TaxID=155640 RepID=A0ACC1YM23_MELAZ|nr:hypothetical protein OWV82_007014 [Melia azedarach]